MVFIPFCFAEAAANILTNPQLDPFGKIPEFKFCAARVEQVAATQAAERASRRAAERLVDPARRGEGGGILLLEAHHLEAERQAAIVEHRERERRHAEQRARHRRRPDRRSSRRPTGAAPGAVRVMQASNSAASAA